MNKIICSAIKMANGEIIRGHRHHDCIRTARDIPRLKEMQVFEQGFLDSNGEFLSRENARIVAEKAKQGGVNKPFLRDGTLFSEDLW